MVHKSEVTKSLINVIPGFYLKWFCRIKAIQLNENILVTIYWYFKDLFAKV